MVGLPSGDVVKSGVGHVRQRVVVEPYWPLGQFLQASLTRLLVL